MNKKWFVLALFSQISFASQKVVLGLIIFPPQAYINPISQECEGKAVSTTKAIFRQANIDVDIVCTGAARIYKLIEHAQIDFTINIKSTLALQSFAEFVEPQFGVLELNFYKNVNSYDDKSIAAIRGFDYNGYRKKYEQQEYVFVDVPTSLDAIRLFHSNRTQSLISYAGPYEYTKTNQGTPSPNSIEVTNLSRVSTHYAVSLKSSNRDLIKTTLVEYAATNKIKQFLSLSDASENR